jgi:hypothetical protein
MDYGEEGARHAGEDHGVRFLLQTASLAGKNTKSFQITNKAFSGTILVFTRRGRKIRFSSFDG